MTTINEIEGAMQGAKHLGDIVLWRAHGGVPPAELERAITEAELDDVEVPDISPLTVFRSAVQSVARDRKLLVQKQVDDAGALVVALIEPTISGEANVGDAAGVVRNRVLWRKAPRDGEDQFVFATNDDPVADAIRAKHEYGVAHLSSRAIRELLAATVRRWGAVPLHKTGGIYWLPKVAAGRVRKLRAALAQVGSSVFTIPVPDLEDARGAFGLAARRQVSAQIEALRDEAAKWREGVRTPRPSTLNERLEQYQAIKRELEDLGDALSMQVEDLGEELEALRADCAAMLGVGGDEMPDPPEEFDDDDEELDDEMPDPPELEASGSNGRPRPPAAPVLPGQGDDFESMNLRRLKQIARDRGLRVRGLGKAAIVAMLRA